jgi:hypothetical protein
MEGVNSFEKGLHRTNSPVEQPEGSYVDAFNWIRNDSGRLVNEELEELIKTLPNSNYELLGHTPVNDLFVCFFSVGQTYSEIGTFNKGFYKKIYNDIDHPSYKLNFQKEIDCVARINNQNQIIVYFVEEGNPIRRFNLSTYDKLNTTYDTLEDFNLQLNFKMPYCTLKVTEDTGGLSSGVYSIVLRYRDEANNKTTCNIPTKFISITDDAAPIINGKNFSDSIDGCAPETITSKSIYITLKHVDTNYKFIEVIVITYIGIANNLTIKSLGIYDNVENKVINFSSLLQLQDSVPTEEITEVPTFYNTAKSIEQKDNVLILSNLTSKRYDEDFQKVADNIDLFWSVKKYDLQSPRAINSIAKTELNRSDVWDYRVNYNGYGASGDNAPTIELPRDQVGNNTVDSTDFWQSNIYQDPTILKGFTRGEVYSFSITPIFKDGSVGFAYHIPGKVSNNPLLQKLEPWISSEDYPDYMNKSSGAKIQHHKMPDFNRTGALGGHNFSGYDYTGSFINVLQVEAKNVNFGSLTSLIQGYVIGYQQRNSDLNTRIIDYGFMRPYLKAKKSDKYRNSFFTGNSYYFSYYTPGDVGQSDSWSAQESFKANSPYAQYYSIDTLYLNKQLTSSYSIQEIGNGINLIPNLYSNAVKSSSLPLLIAKNQTTAKQAFLYLFFEEGKTTFISNPPIKKIDNTEYVPNIFNDASTTFIGGSNQPIGIKQTSRFWHIEVETGLKAFSDVAISDQNAATRSHQYRVHQNEGGTSDDVMQINNSPSIRLTRIVNDIGFQYGRLENAEYIPSIVVFDDQTLNTGTTSLLLEGDTYVCKTFMRKWDLLHSAGENIVSEEADDVIEWLDAHMIIGMYTETKNNLTLRYKEINGPDYYPKYRKIWGSNADNFGIMNAPYASDTFSYNKQYSALSNIKVNIAEPLFFTDVTQYPNRSIYSNKSFESELVDQYRIFPTNQFHDIPKDRGVITDTFVFNNNFFHHTEFGLWQSYFNPNTTQSTSQGEIVLGNGGIFQIPSKLVLDIKGGYMGTKDKSGTNTPFGRVFLDHYQGKVFLFAGDAPVEISDLGLFEFFRGFVNTNDKYCMGYDWANKRLLISNINKDRAISFYPKTQTWTSRHTFAPTSYLTLNRESYAWRNLNTSFYNLTNSQGIRKDSYITFVENTQPDAFKRFDKIEINTMSGGNQGIFDPGSIPDASSYTFLDKSFTHIHCWTDRQNSTELEFAYSHDYNTNFLNGYDNNKVPLVYYKNSFHAEFPLDAVVNPYVNIFDNNNLQTSATFKSHMKGKFLYTKLSYKNTVNNGLNIPPDKPLVLNYIKTYFKSTVA